MSNVTEHLAANGVDYEVLPHDPTVTARAEATVLGLDAHDVVKTVVLDIRTGHAFAVIPADCHLDLDLVRKALNTRHVALASEAEIKDDYPEFELGAIPPLGDLARTPVVADPQVLESEYVVFAGGNQSESIKIHTRDLFDHAQAVFAPICTS